jgi:predicted dehydrogenase
MRIGIVGSGMIANLQAKAIASMDGGTLHSVYNHRAAGAQQLAAAYGVKAFDDLATFLADPGLDAVTVCTPSGAHFDPALAALRAGKHAIVEKPLEVSTARVDRLIAEADRRGLILASILNRRFNPGMDAFREAVKQGRFGKLALASCYVKWFRDQAYYDSAPWRGTWAFDGGGVLMNQGIHAIDSLLHLAGPVVAVHANTTCLAHDGIEVEDTAVAIVEFANGARGVIEGSTATWSRDGHPARIQLSGTDGSAFLADDAFEVWEFRRSLPMDNTVHSTLMKGSVPGLGANNPAAINSLQHQRNLEEIVQAIQQNREPSTSARHARPAIALIEAIYQSARNHGQRTIPA